MATVGKRVKQRGGVLGEIERPTLIIHGENDPLALPRYATEMAAEIPNATLKLIPKMGHMFFSHSLEEQIATLIEEHICANSF